MGERACRGCDYCLSSRRGLPSTGKTVVKECFKVARPGGNRTSRSKWRATNQNTTSNKRPTGALKAIDVLTGEEKWNFQYFSSPNGGALSTSGGVVFAGDSDGNFIVLDAKTGRDLWHMQLGAAIYSTAITFEVDGKQYVIIPAGSALFAFALP